MDIDTISVKPYHDLLDNDVVLGKEGDYGICNAIMMTQPNSEFFKIWMEKYENEFISDGWSEASIILPKKLYYKYPNLISLQGEDVFFLPSFTETDKIFEKNYNIPKNLITLHLWESYSMKYIKNIDPSWVNKNKHTLYSKIVNKLNSLNVFDNIYINGEWGKGEVEFYSGSGSESSKNNEYINFLTTGLKCLFKED